MAGILIATSAASEDTVASRRVRSRVRDKFGGGFREEEMAHESHESTRIRRISIDPLPFVTIREIRGQIPILNDARRFGLEAVKGVRMSGTDYLVYLSGPVRVKPNPSAHVTQRFLTPFPR